jgi:hypothetical protein
LGCVVDLLDGRGLYGRSGHEPYHSFTCSITPAHHPNERFIQRANSHEGQIVWMPLEKMAEEFRELVRGRSLVSRSRVASMFEDLMFK